jgi:D-alanyl-lipoteichoic acid acyltransferase DltB (MBOAT superfamily)
MAWGLFKKVVIADRLAIISDQVYNNPYNYEGLGLIIGTLFFTFQIYCDFSGYSDMAIGAAKVMGFKLMTNFKRPYFAKNISEFWKRWHISLSTWFKDYLYISLGGNRVIKWRWYFNLFFVFLISGFWHGANWTFVIWGALHGFYLVFAVITYNARNKINVLTGLNKLPGLNNLLSTITTFCLVSFSWIFFRAKDMKVAVYVVRHLFDNLYSQSKELFQIFKSFFLGQNNIGLDHKIFIEGQYLTTIRHMILAILFILFMELVHFVQERRSLQLLVSRQPAWVRWTLYYGIMFIIIFFGVFENRQFIYFQF